MPSAEIIAIGTELLLGEITDTNSQYLAKQLRECGIDHYRNTTVGDNLQRIAALMQESLTRADIVITTGGLGPTVDDPTRDAAAQAFNTHNEFHPELWDQIKQRFLNRSLRISENNMKQAMIPSGATVIENPVGTAPAFILTKNEKALVCLPGVPREMEYLMQNAVIPWLKQHYPLSGTIKARVIHVGAMAESKVDELIGDLETMSNPSVGLLAHPGIVDIRITAKAQSVEIANQMISEVESTVRERLGKHIYGVDEDTYFSAIQKLAMQLKIKVIVLATGFEKNNFASLINDKISIIDCSGQDQNADLINTYSNNNHVISCNFAPTPDLCKLECDYHYQGKHVSFFREYIGTPGLREEWASNFSLNFIRLQLLEVTQQEENHDKS